ncbi:NADH-quinone oxidoreductase subunit L, partial [Psychrobacter sp. 1U2]
MSLLPLTFILPLIGFLILAFMRDKLTEQAAAFVGVGSMLLSALCALVVSYTFLMDNPAGTVIQVPLWTWFQVGDFAPSFALSFDGLALTMTGIITGIGFLIHLFAAWY